MRWNETGKGLYARGDATWMKKRRETINATGRGGLKDRAEIRDRMARISLRMISLDFCVKVLNGG
jgi:hypothetical protein